MPDAESQSTQQGRDRAAAARLGDAMNEQNQVQEQDGGATRLPEENLHVDFGSPVPGFSEPMPEDRRAKYESRIRNSLDAQAAGAEKASKLFIR